MKLKNLKKELRSFANPSKAKLLQRFFKTGKGEYGEGDVFLGLVVPEQRKIAKKYCDLTLRDLQELIKSKIHEERLISLFILINKYDRASAEDKKEIYEFYLKNAKYINNWDLVDLSAPNIPGAHLVDKNREVLYSLAKSENLWEKRIAILSCFSFIKNGDFDDALKIAEILLHDKHDLIHKAVGWMLREIGKRNKKAEEVFLKKYYKTMPRTMLRYAIEKFPENERKKYLNGSV
ncbi:MAG: DNA alkylation repair protein [Nanoarchaeota archaeon]